MSICSFKEWHFFGAVSVDTFNDVCRLRSYFAWLARLFKMGHLHITHAIRSWRICWCYLWQKSENFGMQRWCCVLSLQVNVTIVHCFNKTTITKTNNIVYTLNILCGLNYVLTNLCVFFPVFSLQVSKNLLKRNFNGWGKILVLLKRVVHYRYTSTLRRILPSSMEGCGRPITSILHIYIYSPIQWINS